jgi:hypothetical protein
MPALAVPSGKCSEMAVSYSKNNLGHDFNHLVIVVDMMIRVTLLRLTITVWSAEPELTLLRLNLLILTCEITDTIHELEQNSEEGLCHAWSDLKDPLLRKRVGASYVYE